MRAMKKAAAPSILVAIVLLALGGIAEAQQPTKVPRIGFLRSLPLSANPSARFFRARRLGANYGCHSGWAREDHPDQLCDMMRGAAGELCKNPECGKDPDSIFYPFIVRSDPVKESRQF